MNKNNRGFYLKEEIENILDSAKTVDRIMLPVRIIITGYKFDVGFTVNMIMQTFKDYELKINMFKDYNEKKGKYDPDRIKAEIRVR